MARARARLVEVASVSQPTAMAVRPNDDAIYVTEKTGRVRRIPRGQTANPGAAESSAVLDLSGRVSTGSEQGLLGLTFSPDGSRLYVDYTDRAGDTHVVEYPFREGRADADGARELLFVDQPFANHNGGQILFGPDGKFYISLGDGGSGNDPNNRAQNLGDLLGKILRIDPQASGSSPYTVPPDNPFVGRSGARPEVWMYGLRNPWRFTWDRQTKDLWIADVGQNRREEIDFLPAGSPSGANFGWPLLEGTARLKGSNPPGGILPIFEYGRDDGCSVTGGYVYRGSRVPSLRGIYVYGDACTGTVWGLTQSGGEATGQQELTLDGLAEATGRSGFSISSFGEDGAGELYLLSLGGGVYRFDPA
ncbi:MAG: PQQ-dependent sugar dehydrogenase [Actinomycetota bacterium]|nr:PQQ-dependent sugar dehydrogenase [Actinomycetota bacterium]